MLLGLERMDREPASLAPSSRGFLTVESIQTTAGPCLYLRLRRRTAHAECRRHLTGPLQRRDQALDRSPSCRAAGRSQCKKRGSRASIWKRRLLGEGDALRRSIQRGQPTAAITGCGLRRSGSDWNPAFAREAVVGKDLCAIQAPIDFRPVFLPPSLFPPQPRGREGTSRPGGDYLASACSLVCLPSTLSVLSISSKSFESA